MKRIANKLIRDEKGQALILVVLLLLVGALIITPLLGFMSTGIRAGQTFETKMDEFYAADAGVENGLWKLSNDPPASYPYPLPMPNINGKSVTVTIDDIGGSTYAPTYRITSTTGGTTIIVYVDAIIALLVLAPGEEIEDTDLYVQGDLTLGADAEIEGGSIIAVGGNLTLGDGAEIEDADIWVGGDLIVGPGTRIRDGSVICVGGDLIVSSSAQIEDADIYVGSWVWDEDLEIFVYAPGNVSASGADIDGTIYSNGTADVSVSPFPEDGCPFTPILENEILTWEIN